MTLNWVLIRSKFTLAPLRWSRHIALWLVLLVVGAMTPWVLYTRANDELTQALKHVEAGAIPNEPDSYADVLRGDLKQSTAQVLAGAYSNITQMGAVTYNAVLVFKPDGNYDYALSVGNGRVHKRYGHRGLWWVQGRVLHTVLVDGDAFLAAPESRNHVRPSRERILDSSAEQLTLQAHYGPPVSFQRVQP